jgi:hypothetical protein
MNAHEHPPDMTLLLRAHSEQRWLSREVIPVVRQIETGARLPDEQLPAAIAYLEVIWAEAVGLAHEADMALRRLDMLDSAHQPALDSPHQPALDSPHQPALDSPHQPLTARARRYHACVRALRTAVARHVTPLIVAPRYAPAEAGLRDLVS